MAAEAAGTWTSVNSSVGGRVGHTATLLPNGLVLVVGGVNDLSDHLASAELYNPSTGTWTPTGSLATGRAGHTATLLPNGQVLVAGGVAGSGYPHTHQAKDPPGEPGRVGRCWDGVAGD